MKSYHIILYRCTTAVILCVLAFLLVRVFIGTHNRVILEFDIVQNEELILFSGYGEPPQFAIWLEDPVSGKLQTVFVTYRSATGDWEGKFECPVSLPRWFEVYQQETSTTELPRIDTPAPIAVTGATPKADHFKIRAEVEPGSHWICWIEVNLAADFNADYQQYNETEGTFDTHFSGQPALVYRGEITAVVGECLSPQLYGMSVVSASQGQTVQPVSKHITTAKNIFKSINIRAIRH
jgi:hypothetical protein